MRDSRDLLYLEMTGMFARRGTCARRKVGCILTDARGRILAHGYNGVASGRPHCNEGHPCPGATCASGEGLDLCEAIHAEQNAVLMLRDPHLVENAYVSTTPCLNCMKLLLGTSCRRIYALEEYPHPTAIRWWKEAGRQILVAEFDGWKVL